MLQLLKHGQSLDVIASACGKGQYKTGSCSLMTKELRTLFCLSIKSFIALFMSVC